MSDRAIENARAWLSSIREMVGKLDWAIVVQDATDEARREIEESALAVYVRSGWYAPGIGEPGTPEEYQIWLTLTPGEPALRITGRLDHYAEPADMARLEWQDWGTPWTEYDLSPDEMRDVVEFARVFFGDR